MRFLEGMFYYLEQQPEMTFNLNASSVLLSDDDQEPLISQFMIGDGTNSSSNGSFFENIKYRKFKVKCVFLFVLSSTDYLTLDCLFWK